MNFSSSLLMKSDMINRPNSFSVVFLRRYVNPDTAERVLQVAKRLGYRRNNAAASLRSGRSHSIAVIVSDIANPFYAEICRNIENIAYKDGYTVIFASSEESPQKLSHLVETMVGYNVEERGFFYRL